jgi:hypothetical protein
MQRSIAYGLLLICTAAAGEEPTAATTPKFDFAAAAAKYAVEVRGSGKECESNQIDLLKWSNPIRGTLAGSVFLWTQGGIPAAACCMYAYRTQDGYAVDHELVSLTTEEIAGRHAGELMWQTEAPGIAWSPIPNAPAPAAHRSGRLVQMRKMATSFAGYLGTPATRRQELRLLPQPIYRFPDLADSDGGVFAYVQTTDPEVLLLMRANLQAQPATWEFAAARMTIVHAFLTVEEVRNPPPGDLVLTLQKRGGWLGLFKRPRVFQAEVEARKLPL